MAYRITEKCTECGACQEVCPSSAIEKKGEKFEITDKCEECGSCVEVCFLEAIEETYLIKEEK
jgi:MinD superfamily P-loop ATPase